MTCKRIGPKCNVAPVLKILGVQSLPPGGSLGTGKRDTVPKFWRAAPIFLARVNEVSIFQPWKAHFNHSDLLAGLVNDRGVDSISFYLSCVSELWDEL